MMNPELARKMLEREIKLAKWAKKLPVGFAYFLGMETIFWSNANVHKRGLAIYSREEVLKSLKIIYIC